MQQSESATAHPARKTAYVLKVYPRFSETFIVTEILAREAAGESLEIFALRPTTDTRFHPEIARVQAPVTFLPKPYKLSDAWALFADATATIPGFARRYAELLPELATYDAADVHQAVHLACEVSRRGITHLHAHFGSLAGQTAEVAALLAGIQYSVTTHAKDIFHESVVPARLGRTIARSHHIITISEYNLNHLATQYPDHADKLHLVYNGLELERFPYSPPAAVNGSRPLQIAAVGRMVEKKGFFDLVAAAGRLVAKGIPVEVRIAGEGDLFARIQTAIDIAGLNHVITLLGARTQQEVRDLLTWADVFAAPSIVGADGNADGLPTVLLEAMASGVPCVASTVTGIPEAIEHGVTGFLHTPGDVDELVSALATIADPAFDRQAMAAAGRRHIDNRFDSHSQARTLVALEDGRFDDVVESVVPSVPRISETADDAQTTPPVMDLHGKRIAYVCVDPGIPVFGTKGASVHVQEVVREFIRRGADVTIFATRTGDDMPADLDGVEVVHRPIKTKETAEREGAQHAVGAEFAFQIAAGGFDLVYERYSLFSTALAQVAPAGIPGILEVNAPLIDEQRTHRHLVDEKLAHRALVEQTSAAAHTIAVSAMVADWVAGTTGGADVTVVPNGVNTDRIAPGEDPLEHDRPTVAFVGTLKPWHGVETLVEAAALAQQDWDLRIIGHGPQGDSLRARVKDAGLQHRVSFTGAVTPEAVPGLLTDCSIATAPYPAVAAEDSYFSPLKVYEYLAAGLPVVASAIGQIPQILDGTDAGVLVAPSDAQALADAIDELVVDAERRDRMARNARALAVSRHSWSKAVDTILSGVVTQPAETAETADNAAHAPAAGPAPEADGSGMDGAPKTAAVAAGDGGTP
ncbi:glycosyltransferase family 4 protein [Kocuria atrinae]|uniref:D-inositol 3-phosphate glycosyltransferase n=1 Tax=Kocuria atrinae TaxID=592377 RepID=A0ABN2XPB9_9MICC